MQILVDQNGIFINHNIISASVTVEEGVLGLSLRLNSLISLKRLFRQTHYLKKVSVSVIVAKYTAGCFVIFP